MVYKIFLNIVLFFLCIDGLLLTGDALLDIPIRTPFDLADTVTPIDQPNYYNSTDQTNTLYANITGYDIQNATSSGASGTLNPIDTLLYPIAILQLFIDVLTNAYPYQVMALFGFPSVFLDFVITPIFGYLGIFAVIYFFTNRG